MLQYFDHITGVPEEDLSAYGGAVEIADYCPFSQEFSWHVGGEYQRSSYCRIQENQPGGISLPNTTHTFFLTYNWSVKSLVCSLCFLS